MDSASPDPSDSQPPSQELPIQSKERVVALVVIGLVLLYALWTLRAPAPVPSTPVAREAVASGALLPEMVPLVTGDEPIIDIFTRAGCPVCHTIPEIPGANGQVGPRLVLGTTGEQRLNDPGYKGQARTVHDYVVESVLEPGRFVVPGYPEHTMPVWYGSKLSALALEKIAAYLEQQVDSDLVR
jgi:hypothetical protein